MFSYSGCKWTCILRQSCQSFNHLDKTDSVSICWILLQLNWIYSRIFIFLWFNCQTELFVVFLVYFVMVLTSEKKKIKGKTLIFKKFRITLTLNLHHTYLHHTYLPHIISLILSPSYLSLIFTYQGHTDTYGTNTTTF